MAQAEITDTTQPHPRSMSCPCDACNEDLLVFSDDETSSETEVTTEDQETDLDTRSDIAVFDSVEPYRKSSTRKDPYDPAGKGDATWDGYTIFTADGWILTCIPIHRKHYESIKGIDLVRWFTETYIKEQKAREERKKTQAAAQPYVLYSEPTPPPTPPSEKAKAQKTKNRRRQRKKNTKEQPPRPSRFLALPPELRNKVYSYVIPESRILVRCTKSGKIWTHLKTRQHPATDYIKKPRSRLFHVLDNDDIQDGRRVQSSMLLVCKKIKEEVNLFIYAQLTFCFDSTKVLRKFIDRSTDESLRAITKLEILHLGYGEPKLTANRAFKQKHDRNWHEACQLISEEMLSLQSLELTLHICEWPVTLREDDCWMRSALEIVLRGPLKHARVNLAHNNKMVRRDRLVRAARRLENQMMTEEGRHVRDEQEATFLIQQHFEAKAMSQAAFLQRLKMLPPEQTKRVLEVVMVNKENDVLASNQQITETMPNAASNSLQGNDEL